MTKHMTAASNLNVGGTAMLNDEEVHSIHGQSGHGVLQLL